MQYVKYTPMALFCLFVLKALFLTPSIGEFGTMAILGAFAAYYERAHNQIFQKQTEDKLDIVNKRFEAVDSHITQLYKNDKEVLTQVQKLALPASVKAQGFGGLR